MSTSSRINPKDLFTVLITQLTSSAWSQLGVTANPLTGKKEINLDAAVMTIGILEALLFKTVGNLNKSEDKFLSESVRDLKLSLMKTSNGKTENK